MKKIKLLILGKSNVGKSSLINFFTNNHNCLVSSKIHATRISTYYLFNIDNYQIQTEAWAIHSEYLKYYC